MVNHLDIRRVSSIFSALRGSLLSTFYFSPRPFRVFGVFRGGSPGIHAAQAGQNSRQLAQFAVNQFRVPVASRLPLLLGLGESGLNLGWRECGGQQSRLNSLEQGRTEGIVLGSDALLYSNVQKNQVNEAGICVEYDALLIHEPMFARLYHDGLVGVRTFGSEVYDDGIAGLGIHSGDQDPEVGLVLSRLRQQNRVA